MALDIIYILLLIAWAGICLGFFIKDYLILSLSSMFLIVWSINALMKGIMGYQDWLTEAFAVINMMVACYIFVRGGYELYKDR